MKISREFKIALKLNERPAYVIAQEAGVDPRWLSAVLNGAVKVRRDDKRIHAIARVLNIPKKQIYEGKQNI